VGGAGVSIFSDGVRRGGFAEHRVHRGDARQGQAGSHGATAGGAGPLEPGGRELLLGLVVVEAARVGDLVGSEHVAGLAGGGEEFVKPTLSVHDCSPSVCPGGEG